MILRSLRSILASLRARIVAAALLWTVGLLVMIEVGSAVAAETFPGFRPVDQLILSLIATGCAISGLLLAAGALRRLDRVRTLISAVRAGEQNRLSASGLSEIEPLVREMNELLEYRETVVQRALATAGDLAHGLKTPLAVMAWEADRLETLGQHESAASIAEQVERMGRQVDIHLARARASGAGSSYDRRTEVVAATERLVETMRRLNSDSALTFELSIAEPLTVSCEPEDFDEMLGNLLDNACKWAVSVVQVTVRRSGDDVTFLVEDDGPGIDAALRDRVLQRGVRADQTAPGHGLGLAIVKDLAALYHGSFALEPGDRGGLRSRLVLRSAAGGTIADAQASKAL
ncbi:MAG TPA: ATP-binding protein [Thermoanaerobaculia bacterium]|nr:ATP-binding protein [Thermoanaerobaculia bacterium]